MKSTGKLALFVSLLITAGCDLTVEPIEDELAFEDYELSCPSTYSRSAGFSATGMTKSAAEQAVYAAMSQQQQESDSACSAYCGACGDTLYWPSFVPRCTQTGGLYACSASIMYSCSCQ